MLSARSWAHILLVAAGLGGVMGCAHGQAEARYSLANNALVLGTETIVELGPPAATYQISLIQRGEHQFLVHESFTNDKRVLMVELLPGKLAGRVVSLHRNLMAVDMSGAPAWTGVEVLDSGVPLDDGIWDQVFAKTDALQAPSPDASGAPPLGTSIPVRSFRGEAALREYRVFSPTPTEAPLDLARLGSLPLCAFMLESGGLVRYAAATRSHGIVDFRFRRSRGRSLTGTYRLLGETREIPLSGERVGGTITLRTPQGHALFEGQDAEKLLIGRWTIPGEEPTDAVLGCAEL